MMREEQVVVIGAAFTDQQCVAHLHLLSFCQPPLGGTLLLTIHLILPFPAVERCRDIGSHASQSLKTSSQKLIVEGDAGMTGEKNQTLSHMFIVKHMKVMCLYSVGLIPRPDKDDLIDNLVLD